MAKSADLKAMGAKGVSAYHFVDHWYVDAPIEAVWPVIRDVSGYPRWWKDFIETRRVNDIDGVGAVVWVHVKAALPYHLYYEVEAVREEPPRLTAARALGDLTGDMMWTLEPDGPGTHLTFEQTTVTGKTLLTILAPLLKPLFMWNHRVAMRSGEQGLRQFLGAQTRAATTRLSS